MTRRGLPTHKTELVPALWHLTAVWQVMILDLPQEYTELPILGSYLAMVIPLLIFCSAIPEINCFPIGVVLQVEGAPVDFELVGEDEIVFLPIETCVSLS